MEPASVRRPAAPASSLHFVRAGSAEFAVDALASSTIDASSRGLAWDGVVAEVGCVPDWQADDLALAGHFIAMNRASEPLFIENKGPHGFNRIVMPPGSVWISPAGQSFTRRNQGVTRWGAVEVSVDKVRRALGRDIEIRGGCGISDEPLEAVVRALLLEAMTNGSSGPLFAESLGIAVAWRLARQFGESRDGVAGRGAIDSRLTLVLEKIEDTIGEAITIADLAAIAHLSPAHFAREFKRCTRQTPHAFVMDRRIERARQALAGGSSIAEAAATCGFSDQAHLSRLFKRRYGMTPGCFVRAATDRPSKP
ncbi:MAG: hypothetical protein JWN44_4723 [Myxococcales bacterium]|nr:hypothetical protein [Myxococcales bacterium]